MGLSGVMGGFLVVIGHVSQVDSRSGVIGTGVASVRIGSVFEISGISVVASGSIGMRTVGFEVAVSLALVLLISVLCMTRSGGVFTFGLGS